MKKIILFTALICQMSIIAQNYKFGKVSKEEIEEKFYPLDSTADAAYIYKYRRSHFDYNKNKGFMIITEVHERIKIYTKEGFEKATKSIVYYKPDSGDNEKVSSIKGYTFNLSNGKIDHDKLSKSSIFDENLSKYRSVKKITFPNVKEGSVIDIEYTIESPYTSVIEDVDYQFDIPVKHFKTQIETPEYYTFNTRQKGYYLIPTKKTVENRSFSFSQRVSEGTRTDLGIFSQSEVQYSKTDVMYNIELYEAKNIPGLSVEEPFITDVKNYRGGVQYELKSTQFPNSPLEFFSNSWESVSEQIYKSPNFGGELEKSSYFKDDLKTLIATAKNDFEKVNIILEFVKRKVKWNNYNGIYAEEGLRKAYKEGAGNIAEINLILTAMLRSAGLNASPVLASTRRNGIPIFPTLEGFNYVITIVKFPNNKYILLDASEPYSSPNILPERILNWNGRVVSGNGASEWVKLSPFSLGTEDNIVMVKINGDLTTEGLIRTKYQNFNALKFRTKYNGVKEESLIANFEEKYGVEVENFKISNSFKLQKPISRSVKFSSNNLIEQINDKLYIEPLLFLTQRENPFKLEDRNYPVDFASPLQYNSSVSIQIPEGYKIESVPETLAIGLPDKLGFFKYQIISSANKVKVISTLQFNSAVLTPQYYKDLKKFYGDLVQKETEKIVLIKS